MNKTDSVKKIQYPNKYIYTLNINFIFKNVIKIAIIFITTFFVYNIFITTLAKLKIP